MNRISVGALGSVSANAGLPAISKALGSRDNLIPLDIRLVNENVTGLWESGPPWGLPVPFDVLKAQFDHDPVKAKVAYWDNWRFDRVYLSPQRIKAFMERSGLRITDNGDAFIKGKTNATFSFDWLFAEDEAQNYRNFLALSHYSVYGYQFRVNGKVLPVLRENSPRQMQINGVCLPLLQNTGTVYHMDVGYELQLSYQMSFSNTADRELPVHKWVDPNERENIMLFGLVRELNDIASQA